VKKGHAMPVTENREQCLALGVNLGWAQQGAGFGGRPARLLGEDLERVRGHAGAAGFTNFTSFVDIALTKLNQFQPVASIVPEVNGLIATFQSSSSGIALQSLDLGIRLGTVGQGTLASTRPLNLALDDLKAAELHAHAVGFKNFEGLVATAMSQIRAGQNLNAANEINALINFLQAQH
jgi:hypothetical protein